jgi:hypothetical protein
MNWNVLANCTCTLLSNKFSKNPSRGETATLGKAAGCIFYLSLWKGQIYTGETFASYRLAMAWLMQILTVRFLSIEHGMGHVGFHGTTHVDWPRSRTCICSLYGSCKLAMEWAMKIFTVRFLCIGQGMYHVDFHSMAYVEWLRNGFKRFSGYGPHRLATKWIK